MQVVSSSLRRFLANAQMLNDITRKCSITNVAQILQEMRKLSVEIHAWLSAIVTGQLSTELTATGQLSTELTATRQLSTELTGTGQLYTELTATGQLSVNIFRPKFHENPTIYLLVLRHRQTDRRA
jgi:hypothetical protein